VLDTSGEKFNVHAAPRNFRSWDLTANVVIVNTLVINQPQISNSRMIYFTEGRPDRYEMCFS
jgi:hypothetical protein